MKIIILFLLLSLPSFSIGRGLVAYRTSSSGNFYTVCVSWRYLETDDVRLGFNIYKASVTNGTVGTLSKLNASPLTASTFYKYTETDAGEIKYFLRTVVEENENPEDIASYLMQSVDNGGGNPYIQIPMKQIDGDTGWTYSPNDASFADLDGDGEMEIVIHRVGPNAKDNSQSGVTEAPVFQAYKLDGTFMWEINLGINIRDGAHYTQFLLYDLDGDGKAEFVCKTAEGGKDAAGNNIGEAYFPAYKNKYKLTTNYDPNADYRNSSGYILRGPEFLTVFNGETGVEIVTTEYDPPRYSSSYNNGNEVPKLEPTSSEINSRWGDNYGNRCDRFLACIAFLDGIHPSIVMCRGYYTRSVLVAYDYSEGELTKRWKFDTYNSTANAAYAGQGNHNLRVADVDGDGFDEIIYGSMAVDHDGAGLYNTKLGHGDAQHLTDFIPERPGFEVLSCHENKVEGTTLRDAATGEIIWQLKSSDDVGRCMGTDIAANFRGMEFWSSRSSGIINANNLQTINSSTSAVSMNMACWWDGDLLRELQDGTAVTKYNNGSASSLLSTTSVSSNNGTKANPCIVGDIIGDWREEVVLRTTNNRYIRIYPTSYTTNYRFHTFLQDHVYRMSIVYQNVAYNQPTHTGFYFGADLENIFVPEKIEITSPEYELDPIFDATAYQWSDGSDTKKIVLYQNDYSDGKEHKLWLDMNYHGHIFSDTVAIQFTNQSGILPMGKTMPIALVNSLVKNEISVQFGEKGIYNCFIYAMNGNIAAKTTLIVGGQSVQTFGIANLPAGNYIIVIENENNSYRAKFLKR